MARATMDIREKTSRVLEDPSRLEGMRRAFEEILRRQRENSPRITDLESRKERLRRTKESSVGDRRLFDDALRVLRENGCRTIVAQSNEDALKAIIGEVGVERLVVKSKSNISKELHLAEHLARNGIEVVETDLGDRIVQLAGCAPVHPTGPACHLARSEIARLFSDHFERAVSEEPSELTSLMRDEIAAYLDAARIGITGANAIAAAEGAVVIVHNEGNAARCAMVPGKHIIVTTPEKVVPDLDEAINVTKLQTYFSTGRVISSYVNIITGPSYTADIEKKVYQGMHGPKEVVVVFVDDGRMSALDKEPQYCIGCGMCLVHCPAYRAVGPEFGVPGHMGGIGVYLAGSLGQAEDAVEGGLSMCTSCGACRVVCPSSVDTRNGIISVRTRGRLDNKCDIQEHEVLLSSVRNYDNPWQVPRARKARWAEGLGLRERGELLFFAGCSTALLFPETARAAVTLLRSSGADPAHLGRNERCCGSTARKLGEARLAREKAEACFEDFQRADAKLVVTSCPGCASALNNDPSLPEKYGVKVMHIVQYLAERIDTLGLGMLRDLGIAFYHDPCDLGRELNVYDEPRALLATVLPSPLVESERSRSTSACCGAGSGVRSAFPDLSTAIARERLEAAWSMGARVVVTACPWCVQNLREARRERDGIEVLDIVEVLARALGANLPKAR